MKTVVPIEAVNIFRNTTNPTAFTIGVTITTNALTSINAPIVFLLLIPYPSTPLAR